MAEYIERESALEECDWYANEFCECEYAIMPLKWALENLPAADVRPVVPGKWIRMNMHKGMEQYKCAVCRSECYVPECMGKPMYAFCPICGAMMEES